MSKNKHEKIKLKVTFDELTDDTVYEIEYRTLSIKESKNKELEKAKKAFQDKCGGIATAIEKKETLMDSLKDADELLKMTAKDDKDARSDILTEKMAINKGIRLASKEFDSEYDALKEKDPNFISMTAEYGKVALLELNLKLSGKDKKEVMEIAKLDPEYPSVVSAMLDGLYSDEMKGK